MVISVTLATVLCLGLVACEEKEGDDAPFEQLTEGQWRAAFAEENFENYRCERTEVTEVNPNGLFGKRTVTATLVKEGDKLYGSARIVYEGEWDDEETLEEFYLFDSGDASVFYTPTDNGFWKAQSVDAWKAYEYDIYKNLAFEHIGDYYNCFEYSEANTCYCAKKIEDEVLEAEFIGFQFSGLDYKFKNGKLITLFYEEDWVDGDGKVYGNLQSNCNVAYGGNKVILPVNVEWK